MREIFFFSKFKKNMFSYLLVVLIFVNVSLDATRLVAGNTFLIDMLGEHKILMDLHDRSLCLL